MSVDRALSFHSSIELSFLALWPSSIVAVTLITVHDSARLNSSQRKGINGYYLRLRREGYSTVCFMAASSLRCELSIWLSARLFSHHVATQHSRRPLWLDPKFVSIYTTCRRRPKNNQQFGTSKVSDSSAIALSKIR